MMRSRTAICLLFLVLALCSLPRASAQPTLPDDWRASVITFGPGRVIFERYGHVALRIQSQARRIDVCYDFGNFSFDDPGFLLRFLKGNLRYWMQGKDTARMLPVYIDVMDRTVTEQVLNLSSEQNRKLREFISAQDTEENRYYFYDYFKDNCATRVRDAVDHATDGAIRARTADLTSNSYRSQNRRVVPVGIENKFLMPLMDMAMGPRIDAPLSRWEDCFLPGVLADELDATTIVDSTGATVPLVAERRFLNQTQTPMHTEPAKPIDPTRWTLPFALLFGGALVLLARTWPLGFKLGATLWELFVTVGGGFILLLSLFTNHWVTAWNANLLHFTPLAPLILIPIWASRQRRRFTWAATAAVGLSVVGLLVTISHLTPQRTMPGVLLALPMHAAVLYGLRRLPRSNTTSSADALTEPALPGLAT